jgi:hypothetical protein
MVPLQNVTVMHIINKFLDLLSIQSHVKMYTRVNML